MRNERKHLPFEWKADAAAPGTFTGYGSVFDTIDSYGDTIIKGAFKASLKEWKAKDRLPKLLLQHGGGGFFGGNADDMVPIGKWDEMKEDEHGLFGRGHLFDIDTDRFRSTYTAMAEGELDGLSIGFMTKKSETDEETGKRTLVEIDLWECSIVTFPANDPARISDVKAGGLPTEREFERFLRREAGLTDEQAKTVIAKGFRQVRREAKPTDDFGELLALCTQRAAIFTGDPR